MSDESRKEDSGGKGAEKNDRRVEKFVVAAWIQATTRRLRVLLRIGCTSSKAVSSSFQREREITRVLRSKPASVLQRHSTPPRVVVRRSHWRGTSVKKRVPRIFFPNPRGCCLRERNAAQLPLRGPFVLLLLFFASE